MATPEVPVTEPIAIYKLAHRYLLYDINVVTYLRQKHNIIGVLVGSLPQASQQNVFLGLPLELMPEEARLLVEKGVAQIVDDVAAHKSNFLGSGLSAEERKAYQAALRKQGQSAAREASKRSDDRKKAALKKMETDNWNDIPDDMFQPSTRRGKKRPEKKPPTTGTPGSGEGQQEANGGDAHDDNHDDDSGSSSPLFPASAAAATAAPPPAKRYNRPTIIADAASEEPNLIDPDPYAVTPTVSYPHSLPPPPHDDGKTLESPLSLAGVATGSYPLYKHLHGNGYFLAPGVRFGCQYMAYPGDPLRFHSHFLCNGVGWDDEFDLLDLVGGGRLATGVKKALVFGGSEPPHGTEKEEGQVRAFSVEWAGM